MFNPTFLLPKISKLRWVLGAYNLPFRRHGTRPRTLVRRNSVRLTASTGRGMIESSQIARGGEGDGEPGDGPAEAQGQGADRSCYPGEGQGASHPAEDLRE